MCMYGREFGGKQYQRFCPHTHHRSRHVCEDYVCHCLPPILPPTHMHAHYTSTLTNVHTHIRTHITYTLHSFAHTHTHTHSGTHTHAHTHTHTPITFHSLAHSDTHAHAHITLTIFQVGRQSTPPPHTHTFNRSLHLPYQKPAWWWERDMWYTRSYRCVGT